MLARARRGGKRVGFYTAAMAAVGLWSLPAAGQQSVCPASRTPIKLNFTTRAPQPIYNNRLTITGIANLLRSQGQAPDVQTRGLTLTKTGLKLKGASTLVKRGNGYCAYLSAVDVEFGFERTDVYVPSDFAQGSCPYRVVLDHENQHVALNRNLLKEFAPRMRARLEAGLARARPIFTRDPNAGADAALDAINAQVAGMMREFENQQRQRNARIDSPANYKALSAMCKDWDGRPPAGNNR